MESFSAVEFEPYSGEPSTFQGVSIVIPAYNEEASISQVLTHISKILRDSELPYEIIVVDDSSKDKTAEVVQTHRDIRLIRHRSNRGYGGALKTGIRHARYELVCITDADGTYPNEHIPGMVQRLIENEYDMVVGARTGESVAIPLARRPAKWVVGKVANFVGGENIPDINSGLRVFSRSTSLQFWNILPDGFSFTTTITLAMLTNNYLVDYIPINYHARIGKSKIRPIRDTLNFFRQIFMIALYFAPLKIFLPVSGFLLLLAAGWGLLTLLVFEQLADVTTIVIALAAIQVATIGLLAKLIVHRVPSHYRKKGL